MRYYDYNVLRLPKDKRTEYNAQVDRLIDNLRKNVRDKTEIKTTKVHQYDLAGMLIESGGWEELKLPAIATEDQVIPLTRRRIHHRRIDDILHPAREPRAVLDQLMQAMGSYAFAAQYQQNPVPQEGNIFKAEWFKTYDPKALPVKRGQIVQSWDTASEVNPHSDWSVCITALYLDGDIYILDVLRAKFEIYALRDRRRATLRRYATFLQKLQSREVFC